MTAGHGEADGRRSLQNTLKAVPITPPAARAFELTVMADRIKPLMGVRWQDALDKPLDVWRRELNIEPVRDGLNSWYTRAGGPAAVDP